MPYTSRKKRLEYLTKYRNTHKKESREWRKKNKEHLIEYRRTYTQTHQDETRNKNRKRRLVSGKYSWYGLMKRDYIEYCELCHKENTQLDYHHWNDRNPSKGIWVCTCCHRVCDVVEKGKLPIIHQYLKFKKRINKEYKIQPSNLKVTVRLISSAKAE